MNKMFKKLFIKAIILIIVIMFTNILLPNEKLTSEIMSSYGSLTANICKLVDSKIVNSELLSKNSFSVDFEKSSMIITNNITKRLISYKYDCSLLYESEEKIDKNIAKNILKTYIGDSNISDDDYEDIIEKSYNNTYVYEMKHHTTYTVSYSNKKLLIILKRTS